MVQLVQEVSGDEIPDDRYADEAIKVDMKEEAIAIPTIYQKNVKIINTDTIGPMELWDPTRTAIIVLTLTGIIPLIVISDQTDTFFGINFFHYARKYVLYILTFCFSNFCLMCLIRIYITTPDEPQEAIRSFTYRWFIFESGVLTLIYFYYSWEYLPYNNCLENCCLAVALSFQFCSYFRLITLAHVLNKRKKTVKSTTQQLIFLKEPIFYPV